MKLHTASLLLLSGYSIVDAFTTTTPSISSSSSTSFSSTHNAFGVSSSSYVSQLSSSVLTLSSVATPTSSTTPSSSSTDDMIELSFAVIKSLSFRELQAHCKKRGLVAVGNTAVLRERLLENAGLCENGADECLPEEVTTPEGISFTDDSDPDFEFKSMNQLILEKCEVGHWKAATRKIKQLKKRHATPDRPVPSETYLAVLECCLENRLQGARAAEPARKILEEMADMEYAIPVGIGNQCVLNCLGTGPSGTHDGFGGIDPALAMIAALQSRKINDAGDTETASESNTSSSSSVVQIDTYGAVVSALANDGAVEEAVLMLRAMVVDHCFTPPLSVFADTAMAASKATGMEETVLEILSLAKAAGYELDSIGSASAGRSILASGVIASEILGNLALGLRLLTAASKAEGCAPDRGDDLVASSSKAAQRACTLIHKRAINRAFMDSNWKLAVKLLELMPTRNLNPSNSVLRKVITTCAKNEKSRRATSILFDWIKLAEEGKAEKPPIKVFNTVINTCEICGEEELTQAVLEAMRKTHDTDGNIITFNIALKRLAKLGYASACEGIIVGMLQAGIEPTVVSYTTAIGACAKENNEDPAFALSWIERMKSRNVKPNLYTYNTALACCIDGKLESTVIASKIATNMVEAVETEVALAAIGSKSAGARWNDILPNTYTKVLTRKLMKQLRENWRAGDIDMAVAKATVRVPLLKLVDFEKSEVVESVQKLAKEGESTKSAASEDDEEEESDNNDDLDDEVELEYGGVIYLHKQEHRIAEV